MDLDSAKTPSDLIALVRDTSAAVRAREVDLLLLALAWADAHPDPEADDDNRRLLHRDDVDIEPDHDPDELDPRVPAMIRDGLVLRHRLPKVFERVQAGEVPVWRARRIAQAVAGKPDDVARHLDKSIAPVAEKVGPVILDRVIDEAMMRLYPDERELAQFAALDARFVKLNEETLSETGIGSMTASADWKDLHDFDQTLSAVAGAIAEDDEREGRPADSLDVRRARALGVLADPEGAAAMLARQPAPKPKKQALLVMHVTDRSVQDGGVVARNETTSSPVLEQQVREWCGRTDTHLTVLPVRDLADHASVDRYEIDDRISTKVELLTPTCVFPWCSRPARKCDKDHCVPYGDGGATCDCNLAPLCRRHHLLKTKAGWRYQTVETGVWLWSDPHGQRFLRDHRGTTDVTPMRTAREGPPATGCRRE